MARLFGTDGVRGVANTELTCELAYNLGYAGAIVLARDVEHTPRILVGMDTRVSGSMLEAALCAGICAAGANAVTTGVLPTPAISYLVNEYNCDAGVVISASHNSFEFNGIKFFSSDGFKLPDETEDCIERIINKTDPTPPLPIGTQVGVITRLENAKAKYIEHLCNVSNASFEGVTVAIDCANGAAYQTAPETLQRLGATVHIIHNTPDGININHQCGSTHMQQLQDFVQQNKCDVGLAFDGDADRCLAVTTQGELVDGDVMMAIIGNQMKESGQLKQNTIVSTVMSNMGLLVMGKKNDVKILQTDVGDRYVLEKMIEGGYNLGGEQSGHIIFLDVANTGDGLLSGIMLLKALVTAKKPLHELAKVMTVLPQALVNAKVTNANKYSFMKNEEIAAMVQALETKFDGNGRVLIRPSGTEPLVRVMIEGENEAEIQNDAQTLAELIESKLKTE